MPKDLSIETRVEEIIPWNVHDSGDPLRTMNSESHSAKSSNQEVHPKLVHEDVKYRTVLEGTILQKNVSV